MNFYDVVVSDKDGLWGSFRVQAEHNTSAMLQARDKIYLLVSQEGAEFDMNSAQFEAKRIVVKLPKKWMEIYGVEKDHPIAYHWRMYGSFNVPVTEKEFMAKMKFDKKEKKVRHLPYKWCQIKDVFISDPDGWREDGKSWNAPITEEEFLRRMQLSTVVQYAGTKKPSPKMLKGKTKTATLDIPGGKNLKYESSIKIRASSQQSGFQQMMKGIKDTEEMLEKAGYHTGMSGCTFRILSNQILIMKALTTLVKN